MLSSSDATLLPSHLLTLFSYLFEIPMKKDDIRYEVAKLVGESALKVLKTDSSQIKLTWACHLMHILCYSCGKEMNGIPPLLRVLTCGSSAARHQAAAALTSLVSGVQKCRSLFQSSGGVMIAAAAMRDVPKQDSARNELALLLSVVARAGSMAQQIVDQDGLLKEIMDISVSSETSDRLRFSTTSILAGISSHPELLPHMVQAGIINVCTEILKMKPPPQEDSKKETVSDHILEIIGHLSIDMHELGITLDVSFGIAIARRLRHYNNRPTNDMSKSEKAFYECMVNSGYAFRQDELYRIRMETADPETALAPKASAPGKHSAIISKLITGLMDTDESKSAEAAKALCEMMQKEGNVVKREILEHEDVFARMWKLVKQGKLGWDDKWFLPIDQSKLKFKEELGSGSFSVVYKGSYKTKGGKKEMVAIKALEESIVDLSDMKSELATMSLLSGVVEHMVQFMGYFYMQQKNSGVMKSIKKYHCLVMELIETNLEEILYDPTKKQALTDNDVRHIAHEVALCMEQLHHFTVLHRDLKPANILLNRTKKQSPNYGTFFVKVADFGYARRDSKESLRKSVVGTPAYLAPELVGHSKSDDVGRAADVYSYGVILWEMIAKKKPHDGMESASLFLHVINCVEKKIPIFTPPADCDPAIAEIMAECTHPDPHKRPSFAEIRLKLSTLFEPSTSNGINATTSNSSSASSVSSPTMSKDPKKRS